MQEKSLNNLIPNEISRGTLFDSSIKNGNVEILVRRTAIEKYLGINLSSLASGIIDFEVLPPETRKGVIGILQIPVVIVGPFNYIRRGDGGLERTFVPLALITTQISKLASKLAQINYPEKILMNPLRVGELAPLLGNTGFHVILTSLAVASAIELEELYSCITGKENHDRELSECIEISSLLFETNPTIVDIAKIITGEEDPDISSYKRKIKDTVELTARLLLFSRDLFQ